MEINMKNYDYLKAQVKFMGFGEDLEKSLMEKMRSQEPAFTLDHQATFGQSQISATLHFGRSNDGELYFFNRVDLQLRDPGMEEPLRQRYWVGQENNYTLKERYNMLESRAVFKELHKLETVGSGNDRRLRATGQTYRAWRDLNFKETDEHGNFLMKTMFWDHEKAIEKYPIRELEVPYDRTRLLASLEKGNLTKMTIISGGTEIKGTMAANPRQERFDFYDGNGQRLRVGQAGRQKIQKQEQRPAQTESRAVPPHGHHPQQGPAQKAEAASPGNVEPGNTKKARQARRPRLGAS